MMGPTGVIGRVEQNLLEHRFIGIVLIVDMLMQTLTQPIRISMKA